MSQGLVVLTLALLLGLQAVTTDLYLPALPMLRDSFNGTMAQTQLTLTALLLAFVCRNSSGGPCLTALAEGQSCWPACRSSSSLLSPVCFQPACPC